MDAKRFILHCNGLDLDCRPGALLGTHLMGILNVTPDSFSDGGKYDVPSAALRRAEEMIEEGAKIIDVGGESTRPRGQTYGKGASIVPLAQERDRVVPVIDSIRREFPDTIVSIDTYKPEVAAAAPGCRRAHRQ